MSERGLDAAVVGAGPFGLSVAAWLAGRRVRVFGEPLRTWRTLMPAGMVLRSAWEETSLSAPGGQGTIDAWAAETGEPRGGPIALEAFLRYGDWFTARFVRDVEPAEVALVRTAGDGFLVRTGSGDEVEAAAVVVAVGAIPFAHAPPLFEPFLGAEAELTTDADVSTLAGRRVLVVGAGQSALETAGRAAAAGAEVEIVARSGVHWFADHEPEQARSRLHARLHRLAYPALGYGPPPLNRFALHPGLIAALPHRLRERLTRRLLRPGGSPWVRDLVEGKVAITEGRTVVGAERGDGGLRVRLDDGSAREVDRALLATGFRFALDRLDFLAPELRARVALEHGWPRLNGRLESSVPGLFFAGYAAEGRFGPLSRFVLGTEFAARRVSAGIVSG